MNKKNHRHTVLMDLASRIEFLEGDLLELRKEIEADPDASMVMVNSEYSLVSRVRDAMAALSDSVVALEDAAKSVSR